MEALPIVGSVLGGLSSGDQDTTQRREPWAPAQGWLKDLLAQGEGLQKYYEQNPFNSIQQRGYENLFSDLDAFRSGMAPGLFGMVNNIISNPYQPRSMPNLPGPREYGSNRPMGWAGGGPSDGPPRTMVPIAPGGDFGLPPPQQPQQPTFAQPQQPQQPPPAPTFNMPPANPNGGFSQALNGPRQPQTVEQMFAAIGRTGDNSPKQEGLDYWHSMQQQNNWTPEQLGEHFLYAARGVPGYENASFNLSGWAGQNPYTNGGINRNLLTEAAKKKTADQGPTYDPTYYQP